VYNIRLFTVPNFRCTIVFDSDLEVPVADGPIMDFSVQFPCRDVFINVLASFNNNNLSIVESPFTVDSSICGPEVFPCSTRFVCKITYTKGTVEKEELSTKHHTKSLLRDPSQVPIYIRHDLSQVVWRRSKQINASGFPFTSHGIIYTSECVADRLFAGRLQ
jgi:hypothetical protein